MRSCITAILVFISLSANAQTWQWARAGGGEVPNPYVGAPPFESYMRDMAVDRWGNVYMVGEVFDAIQFSGTAQSFPYYGSDDAVIAKYDKCGNFQWAIINGGASEDENTQVAVDSDGNIYVGGIYYSDNFTPLHVQTTLHTDTVIYGTYAGFYMKYDPNGNLKWITHADGLLWAPIPQSMKVFSNGNLITAISGYPGTWQNFTIPGNTYSEAMLIIDPDSGKVIKGAVIDTLPFGNLDNGIVFSPLVLDANDNIYLPINAYNLTGSGNSYPTEFFGQQVTIPPYAAMLFKADKNLNLVKYGYDDNSDAILSICYSAGALYSAGQEYSHSNYLGDTITSLSSITAGGAPEVYRVYKLDTGTLAPLWESSPQFENSSPFEIYVAATSKHIWMSTSNMGLTVWNNDSIHMIGAGIQQYLFKFDKTTGYCDTIYVDSSDISPSNATTMIMADPQENLLIGGQFGAQFTCGPNTLVPWGGTQDPIFFVEKWGIDCSENTNTADNPYPPADLITTTGGISSINLQWVDNSPYRISFHIYRSPNGINNWQLADTVLGTQTTLTDTGLASNTWYWYKVVAWNNAGESDPTNIDSARTSGPISNVSIVGNVTFCANDLTGIPYTTTAVLGNTYAWTITGGTITSGASTNNVVVSWNNVGQYKLKLTECNGTNCASDSITSITINPVATSSISQTICQGQVFDGFSASGTYIDTFSAANSCDSIRTLHLTVLPVNHATLTQSICTGQSYLGHNQTGTYTDTLSGSNGCDSIRTLNLTVLNNIETTINKGICQGQNYYGHNANGTYIDTFNAVSSCDSIRTLHLTVSANIQTTINQSICPGLIFEGFSQTGTYIDTFTAIGGCDSIRTLNLTVLNNITNSIQQSICEGQSYGGHNTGGTFVDTFPASNGCDSVRTLHLTVLPISRNTIAVSICPGHSYAGYTTAGNYIDTLHAVNGCDSIRNLNLTVLPLVTSSVSQIICQGQSYGGHAATGNYIDTLTSATGCDSIRTLSLTVSASIATNVIKQICEGQIFAGHDSTGIYVDSFTAVGGCDSIRTLNLTVTPDILTTVTTHICQGGVYDGYTANGIYTDTFTSTFGCDSIRTLHLSVNPLFNDTVKHTICQGDTFSGLSIPGFYTDTMVASTGCDSIVTLHLVVNPLPPAPVIVRQGDTLITGTGYNYQWMRDSMSFSANTNVIIINGDGNYSVIITDSSGCSNKSAVLPVTNVGIAGIAGAENILIFPNPAKDFITVSISVLKAQETTLEIEDVTGKLLMTRTYTLSSGTNAGTVDINGLAAGYYEVSVILQGVKTTKAVIKF